MATGSPSQRAAASAQVRLWPGVPDLRALGASTFGDLMGDTGALEGEGPDGVVSRGAARTLVRYPLPGTVHRAGEKRTPPRGAGTGFVYLARWTGGGLAEKGRARLTTPRSSSFAARAWNLYCHLRENGVGTAEPLAMGEETSPLFASRSFLATRELDGMLALPEYLAQGPDPAARRRLGRALGLTLAHIAGARVELPRLELDHVFVSRTAGGDGCAANQLQEFVGRKQLGGTSLPVSQLPEIAIAVVDGGRILERLGAEERLEALQRLAAQVDDDWQLTPRELLRVARHALGADLPRDERRRALRRLLAHTPSR